MGLNDSIRVKFKKSFENKCFQLITDAYNKIISDHTDVSSLMENDISAILNRNIEENSKSICWKIFSKTEHYIFKEDKKIERGFADKQSRIDFVFSIFNSNKKYQYFIEAKNIKEEKPALQLRYITTGIDSFVSKKYENGSLVGYLLQGDLTKTVEGLNSLLKKDNRNSEYLIPKPFSIHCNYYESIHSKIGSLKHLLFDFTINSN